MRSAKWTLLLALAALWGSSFFFLKVLVAELPPLTIVMVRVCCAGVLLNLILVLRKMPMTRALPWRQFLVMGIFNNAIPFSLITWGETRISSGLASILNATTPVFAVTAAHFLVPAERLTPLRVGGVVLGVLGVVVLIGPDALQGLGSDNLSGEAACLLAAVSYAFAGIYGRRFKGLPSLQVATGQFVGAAFVMLPAAAAVDRFWTLPMPGSTALGAFVGLVVLCTVTAYVLYFRILAIAGPTHVQLATFLVPVMALLLGSFVLGERIKSVAVAGMVLIGLALIAISRQRSR